MFKVIFFHELRYWSRQPVVYVFGAILFAIAFLTMWGMASEGGDGPHPEILNSPYRIHFMSNYLSMLMLFILPAIMGGSLFRDYRSRMHTLLYAYPITKQGYLGAKFLSAWLVTALIISLLSLGFMLGSQMPGVQPNVLAPFSLAPYLQLILIFQWPNLLVFGALIFLIIIRTRNIYLSFIAIILLVVGQQIIGAVFSGETGSWLAALLDPIGDRTVRYVVQYWPQAQRDTQAIPVQGIILYNRILWLCIGMGLGLWAYRSFAFQQFVLGRPRKSQAAPEASFPKTEATVGPDIRFLHSFRQFLRNAWHISTQEARHILLSWPFAALLLAGLMVVYVQQQQMNPEFGFGMLPTTGRMLRIPLFIFTLVINLITFLYAGVLIHRGSLTRMGPLLDVCPQPNWVFMLGRWGGIVKVQAVLLCLVMIGGMMAQAFYGYYEFEIGHYLFELFGLHLIHFVIWACMAVLVHSLFRNVYLGFFMLLLIPVGLIGQNTVADFLDWPFLKEAITQFNAVPGVVVGFDYSDLSGYGSILPVYALYKTYWAIAGMGLLLLTLAIWRRELFFNGAERIRQIKVRLGDKLGWVLLTFLVAFLGTGSFIYYQTHFVSLTHFDEEDVDFMLARQESEYGHLAHIPQPRIARASINMDIYPETRDYKANGTLGFINKLDRPLDTIIVFRSLKDSVTVQLEQAHSLLVNDPLIRLQVFKLENSLAPGDSLSLHFTAQNYPNSLLHDNSRVLHNGTYLTDHILPKMEWRDAYVKGKKKRAEFGLSPRVATSNLPEDSSLLGYAYFRNNTDRIHFETVVSTSSDQTAFSMGEMVKEWEEGNRHYFHYKSEGAISNTISWLSGEYTKRTDSIPGHKLEIYHHPTHDHNYPNLLRGLKASLQAGNEWYSPLDHKEFKLIEFPLTEGTHATLNGNLIPFSEALFLCDVDESANQVFDMPFFIAAHEVAHYWWGHRVDPANVRGGKVLTESIADFHAAKVIEKEYGKEKTRAFLKGMHRTYLRERAASGEEYPLVHAKLEQEYLNYRKGCLVMYAMSEYLGEEVLFSALQDFEVRRRFAEPPFPNSLEFAQHLKSYFPDSLAHISDDLMNHITFYDLRVDEATVNPDSAGFWVEVDLELLKYRTSSHGERLAPPKESQIHPVSREASISLREYVQVNFYGPLDEKEEASLIKTATLPVRDIISAHRIFTPVKPTEIIVDPYFRMIDVEREDNRWDFED